MFDTIVAPITGLPPAAVAWVRLSGPEAWKIASGIFAPWPDPVVPRCTVYGRYRFGDDGLVLPFESGASYTGDEVVELSIHGSRASIDALVDACVEQGARLAEPGEFTLRAFIHGRIDLTQAEGVRESCEAETELQLRAASRLREGHLRDVVEDVRQVLLGMLASVEASVDFSEEIGEFDRNQAMRDLEAVQEKVKTLAATAAVGRMVREGFRIALIGPPNAGKSSLLNRLLGVERSIVTEIPGTTRDYVEERVSIGGIPVVLIDTAGLRDSSDPVESIGIQRSRAIAAHADENWYIYDATEGWREEDERSRPEGAKVIANKCDLKRAQMGIPVSALTGEGVQLLMADIRSALENAPSTPYINERHHALLMEAAQLLDSLQTEILSDAPDDLLSVLLTEVIQTLGKITGQTASSDIIQEIFSNFCIGK